MSEVSTEETCVNPEGHQIIIHYYDEEGLPGETKTIVVICKECMTAEEVSLKVARPLNISPLAFHLFALTTYTVPVMNSAPAASVVTPTNQIDVSAPETKWLPPNYQFSPAVAAPEAVGELPEEKVEQRYIFRMRILPSDINSFLKLYEPSFVYLYLQMRSDFCMDYTHPSVAVTSLLLDSSQEKYLGLGIIDMLCQAKTMNYTLDVCLKRFKMKYFIPLSTKQKFTLPWDKQRLKLNMRNELRTQWKYNEREHLLSLRKLYVQGFSDAIPDYLLETFVIHHSDDNLLRFIFIDLKCDRPCLYTDDPTTTTTKLYQNNKGIHICFLDELQSVQLTDEFMSCMLVIKDTIPCHLRFQNISTMYSFASLLSATYRLSVNFHETLCDVVESPIMSYLRRMKAHGPVDKIWAVNRLRSRRKRFARFNYLIKQKRCTLGHFVLIYMPPGRCKPQLLNVILNHHDKYELSLTNSGRNKADRGRHNSRSRQSLLSTCDSIYSESTESTVSQDGPSMPSFDDLMSFIQHYTLVDNDYVELHSCVPPEEPCDPSLLLFGKANPANAGAGEEIRGHQQVNSKVTIISSVETSHLLGEGRYTEVIKGHLDDRVNHVAVKRFKTHQKNSNDAKLQYLLNAVHAASFWYHVSLSELSLKGCTDVHGAIRSSNVMVYGPARGAPLSSSSPVVKLADAGLALYYNTLPLHESKENQERSTFSLHRCEYPLQRRPPIGREISHMTPATRFVWIAPECYDELNRITNYSDIYSFGVFLWECFSYGGVPRLGLDTYQMQIIAEKNDFLPKPAYCPDSIYQLMEKCCNSSPAFRPSTHSIIKELFKALTDFDERSVYTAPSWTDTLLSTDSTLTSASSPHLFANRDSVTLSTGWITDDSQTPLIKDIASSNCVPGQMATGNQLPVSSEHNKDADLSKSNLGNPSFEIQRRPLPAVPHKTHGPELRQSQVLITKKKLGKGYYGVVFKGEYRELGSMVSRPVAIKCLHAKMYDECAGAFEREIKVMLSLKHDNIVKIIGYLPQRDTDHPMQLVMEFVENGSLCQYLKLMKPAPADLISASKRLIQTMLRYAKEIARGISYLHSEGIIHRDLASRNVLVTGSPSLKSDQVHMKISDFGLARVLDPNAEYYKSDNTKVIPAPWCAPESLCNFQFRKEGDVWSFAITVWEIFSYADPPLLCKIDEMANRLHRGDRLRRPQICPKQIYSLILRCWEYYPCNRVTFPDILESITQLQLISFL